MASKRLSSGLSKLQSRELDPSEEGLAEEEEHAFNLNGKLSMDTDNIVLEEKRSHKGVRSNSVDTTSSGEESEVEADQGYVKVESTDTMPTNSISRGLSISDIRRRTVNIKFDIVDTRIAGHRSKHVLYLLVVTKAPGIDSDKAIIERRYSDFYKLYKELRKMFPAFMQSIEFPEKKLYGNLDGDLISTRSRVLQTFVQKIYENPDIRNTDTFKKFFYMSSLQQGCQYICGGQFEEALTFLLNGLHLQQKLALDSSKEVSATLCNIIECYMSLENYEEVVKYGEAALEIMGEGISDIHLVPLLETLKDAYAILGKSTVKTERKIKEVVALNQIEVAHMPSLRELAVKRFIKK